MIIHKQFTDGRMIAVYKKQEGRFVLLQAYHKIGSQRYWDGVGEDNSKCITQEEAIQGASRIERESGDGEK